MRKTTKIPKKKTINQNITRCTGYRIQYDKSGMPTGAKLTSNGKEVLFLDATVLAALEMDLGYQEYEDISLR